MESQLSTEEAVRQADVAKGIGIILESLPEGVDREDVGHLLSLVLGHLGVMPQLQDSSEYARSTDTPETLKRREGILKEIVAALKECRQERRIDRPQDEELPDITTSLRTRLADASVVHGRNARVKVRDEDTKESLTAQGVPGDVLEKIKK